jgi:hypothetical protein
VNTTSVSSAMPHSSSAARSLPTFVSMFAIMP